ncbi:hypothetical protein AgCh_017013 [Apium graveolens]
MGIFLFCLVVNGVAVNIAASMGDFCPGSLGKKHVLYDICAAVGQQTALLRLVHEPLVFSVFNGDWVLIKEYEHPSKDENIIKRLINDYYGEQRTSVGPGMERRSLKDKADQKKHHVDKRKKLLRDYCLGDGNNIPGKRHNNSPIGFRANLPKKQPLIDREKKPHLDYFWDAKNIVPRGSRHCSDIGFDSDPEFGTGDSDDELDDAVQEYASLGPPNVQCGHFEAWMWKEERVDKSATRGQQIFSIYCVKDQIKLSKEKPTHAFLWQHHNDKEKSRRFKDRIQLYINLFAFTSTGGIVHHSINNGGTPYIYRLNGQNHHLFGSLIPEDGEDPKFCQLSESGRENHVGPSDEVDGIMVGDMDETDGSRDIIIDSHSRGLEMISDIHPKLMALQYPILISHVMLCSISRMKYRDIMSGMMQSVDSEEEGKENWRRVRILAISMMTMNGIGFSVTSPNPGSGDLVVTMKP